MTDDLRLIFWELSQGILLGNPKFNFSLRGAIITLLVRRVFAFNTNEKIMQVLFKKFFQKVCSQNPQYLITRFDEVLHYVEQVCR